MHHPSACSFVGAAYTLPRHGRLARTLLHAETRLGSSRIRPPAVAGVHRYNGKGKIGYGLLGVRGKFWRNAQMTNVKRMSYGLESQCVGDLRRKEPT